MPYIIGAAGAILFILCLAAAFYAGYRLGRRRRKSVPAKTAGTDEAARQREEQLLRDFAIISSYNLNKALERRRA
jgi:hypothetical protein